MVKFDKERIRKMRHEHIGSSMIPMNQELEIIKELDEGDELNRQEVYALYMSSKYWRKLRYQVLTRDDFKCVKCGSKANLQVDHINYPGLGEEDLDDLQTLCYRCHDDKTEHRDIRSKGMKNVKNVDLKENKELFTLLRR